MNKNLFIGGSLFIVGGMAYLAKIISKHYYNEGYIKGAKDMTIEAMKIMTNDMKKDI